MDMLLSAIRFIVVHGAVKMKELVSFVAQLSKDKKFMPEATVRHWLDEGRLMFVGDGKVIRRDEEGLVFPTAIAGMRHDQIIERDMLVQVRFTAPMGKEEIVRMAVRPVSIAKLSLAFHDQLDFTLTMQTVDELANLQIPKILIRGDGRDRFFVDARYYDRKE